MPIRKVAGLQIAKARATGRAMKTIGKAAGRKAKYILGGRSYGQAESARYNVRKEVESGKIPAPKGWSVIKHFYPR